MPPRRPRSPPPRSRPTRRPPRGADDLRYSPSPPLRNRRRTNTGSGRPSTRRKMKMPPIPGSAAIWALPLVKKSLPIVRKKGLPLAKKYAKPILKELTEVAENVFVGGGSDPEPLSPPADIKAEQELFEEDLAARTWLQETWAQRDMRDKVEGDKAAWEEEMTMKNARWNKEARKKLMTDKAKKVWVDRKKDKLKAQHPDWWTALAQKEALEKQRKQQMRAEQPSQPSQPNEQGAKARTHNAGGLQPRRAANDVKGERHCIRQPPNHPVCSSHDGPSSTPFSAYHRQPIGEQLPQALHTNRLSNKTPNDDEDNSDWSSYISSSRPASPHLHANQGFRHASHHRSTSAPPPALVHWPGGNERVDSQGRCLEQLSDSFDQMSVQESRKVRGSPLSSEGGGRGSSLNRRKDRIVQPFDVDAYMKEEEQRSHDPMQRYAKLLPN